MSTRPCDAARTSTLWVPINPTSVDVVHNWSITRASAFSSAAINRPTSGLPFCPLWSARRADDTPAFQKPLNRIDTMVWLYTWELRLLRETPRCRHGKEAVNWECAY